MAFLVRQPIAGPPCVKTESGAHAPTVAQSGAAATQPTPDAAGSTPGDLPGSSQPAALVILAGLAVVGALWAAQEVLIPIVFAALLSFSIEPLHRRIVGLGLNRGVAAALLLVTIVGVAAGGAISLRPQANAFVSHLPALTQKLRGALRTGKDTVQPVQQAANELKKAAEESAPNPSPGVTRVQIEEPAFRPSDLLWKGTMGAIGAAAQASMVLFLAFYMLMSGDRYKVKLIEIAGPSRFRKRLTLGILNSITAQVERFLLARAYISATVGAATGLALGVLGLSQPVIWGIAAGVLNNIPYVGPSVVVGAAALTAFVQFGTIEMAAAVGAAAGAIAAIEGFVVTPWLMGRAGRMDTGVVFVSLLFWGWLWGIWGLLFAVPIMMSVKAVADNIDELGFIRQFLRE
jgi:predicted PurR-regulated permease PerM